jgi:putative Ca2+/H+ antiporter (TMEM165/GDT1 family)
MRISHSLASVPVVIGFSIAFHRLRISELRNISAAIFIAEEIS